MRISDWSSDVCSSDLKTHDQPDAGLWEFRTRQLVHTYSAVMSWAACDRLANVAARIGRPEREAHWNKRAAAIRATIEREAWNEEAGHYGVALCNAHLAASLTQMDEQNGRESSRETQCKYVEISGVAIHIKNNKHYTSRTT